MTGSFSVNTPAAGRRYGPYLVEKRLGGGAMAVVYRAVDQRDGRAVALKVLLPDADDTMRERFHQEARMASALHHPNITTTLQISQTTPDGATYIAMELVEGESLGDLLERVRSLNPADSSALLAPIARALAYAHEQGVIHRDVKPSNILLRRSIAPHGVRISILEAPVTPLLSDFGIARALDAPDLTSAGRTIGTPAYMAPEQCAGSREVDGRADIYSLGTVLYRCLVGRPPFTGTTTQILYAHVYDAVSVPDDVLRVLSPLMVEILRRSLAKEPTDRYSSADQMADDLTTVAGRPIVIDSGVTPAVVDSTATMPLLTPAPVHTTTSHVIVSAPRLPLSKTLSTTNRMAIPLEAPVTTPQSEATGAPVPRKGGRGVVIGLILIGVVFLLGAVMVRTLLPEVNFLAILAPATEPTVIASPPATVVAQTASSTVTVQGDPSAAIASPTTPNATPPSGVAPGATRAPEPPQRESVTSVPSPSPQPGPTPVGDIRAHWEDATFFFGERDWAEALNWLTMVQRINPDFERPQVEQMLFNVYVALATISNAEGKFAEAVDYFDRAIKLRPTAGSIEVLRAATQAVLAADPRDRSDALKILQEHHADFAADLSQQRHQCDAADHMAAAAGLLPSPQFTALANSLAEECRREQQRARDEEALKALEGAFIYSAARDGRQQIFTMPAAPGALSQMVIDNGAQPALSPNGIRVAFHSKRADVQGLAGFDLKSGLDPNARSILFTRFTEDSRDSPPAWNRDGNRLVFASTNEADRRSRIYAVWADGQDKPTMLTMGETPAWNWATDQVVFNGADASGQRPGLWLMGSNGANPRPLTEGSGDLRPAWTPDGAAIIFMSNQRDGNWELYRVDVASGDLQRLTDHPAIDALPTVSPDGKWLAFVSNRDGGWRVWVMSLESGNSFPLAGLAGDLPNLLEHGLQWTP